MPRYQIKPHETQGPFSENGQGDGPELESADTTFDEAGGKIFFCSGYGAREIAQAHQKKSGGTIYVNTVSAKIARKDFQQITKTRVQYAVAEGPIFSLIRRDGMVVRAYWPRLGN